MDIERIIVRMLADATQYNRTMDAAESRLVAMAGRMSMLGNAISLPMIAAVGSVTALGTAMGFAATNALHMAASYESAQVSLSVMTGSAQKGKEILDQITKYAVESPFKTPELLKAGSELAAFGVQADQIMPSLKVLGEVAAGVGVEKLPNIVLAFGQIKTAGRLMGQELRQLINANVPMMEYLAKVRNVPVEYIKGMVERAEISNNDVIKAFNMMVSPGGRYFGMIEERSKTVEGRWSAFVETIQVGLRNLGLAFFDTFHIAENLDNMVKAMGTTGRDFGKATFEKIKSILTTIVELIKTAVYWVEKAYDETKQWVQENEKTVEYFLKIGAQVAAIVVLVLAMVVAFKAALLIIGLMSNPIVQLGMALFVVVQLLNQIGGMDNFGSSLDATFKTLTANFKSLGMAFKDAMIAEDWDLVGRIIGLGLSMAFKTLMATIKWEFMALLAQLGMQVIAYSNWMADWTIEIAIRFKELLDPTIGEKERLALWTRRQNMINNDRDNFIKLETEKIEKVKRGNIAGAMDPFKLEIEKIREEAAEKRAIKEHEDLKISNPFQARVNEIEKQYLDHMRLIALLPNTQPNLKGQQLEDTVTSARNTAEYARIMSSINLAGAETMRSAFKNLKPRDPNAMELGLSVSAPALKLAEHVRKEMAEGKWAGAATDKLEIFNRHMELLKEANEGPLPTMLKGYNPSGALDNVLNQVLKSSKLGSVLTDKERDFGMMEEYNNLKKAVGAGEIKMPSVAFKGSQEAQDAINRQQLEVQSVQEEVRNVLLQAKLIQEQTREYNRQVVEELKKLNSAAEKSTGDHGGGGDY